MTKKARRQAQLVEQIAEHLLAHGLADCGLRRLAEVAGTSDRMLLYYFQSKDALLAAVLKQISSSLAASLVQAFGSRPQPPSEVLLHLWTMLKSESMAPHLRLWLELSARAGRGDPLCVAVVSAIGAEWINWTAGLIEVDDSRRRATAMLMMSVMDGQAMIFPQDLAQGDCTIALLAELLALRAPP